MGTEWSHPWVKGCQQAPVHPLLGSQAPRAPCNSSHLPCNQWVTRFLILETPQIPAGKWDLSNGEGGPVCECQSRFQHKGGILEQRPIPLTSPDLKATRQRAVEASSMTSHSWPESGAGASAQVPGSLKPFLACHSPPPLKPLFSSLPVSSCLAETTTRRLKKQVFSLTHE